jgi:hypothetical protein
MKTIRKRTSEFLVANAGCPSPKALYQPQLLFGKVVPVAGERALEILPRSSEKLEISRSPACQIAQYAFAQSSP